MRKAVAQVASKARGNSSKRSRDDSSNNNNNSSIQPARAASPLKSSFRGKESPTGVKAHTKMTPDEAALAAKNYRLAKELSELRVRHREESKTVTKLTMENMTLASKCRQVMQEADFYKKQLDQQRADQQSTPASERGRGAERSAAVTPDLVSSDDSLKDDTNGVSTSIESVATPVSPVTPLISSSSIKDMTEPLPEAAPQATVNPHRFFPQSASPKNLKTAYNEEFPGDIVAAAPSRRMNFQRMGSFEELECEDDVELDASPSREASRHRDAPGLETKDSSQRGFPMMSSLDAFEASFQTDIPSIFSASDTAVPPSDEIYDPFSNSPVKINISAATPIIDKPYEAELPPRSPSRGAYANDPPGVDKTSTRPNGPLNKEVRVEEKATAKVIPPPPRTKAASALSVDVPSSNNASKNKASPTSPERVQPGLSANVITPVLSEQSKNVSNNRVSLAEQVLTVQSKAALLLSTPESPKTDDDKEKLQSEVVSTRKSNLESPKRDKKAAKVKSKEVSPRESSKRDKKTKQTISSRESSTLDERALRGHMKIDPSLGNTLESPKVVDKELLRGSASKQPRMDSQTVTEEKQPALPLQTTSEALPVNSEAITNSTSVIYSSQSTVNHLPPGASGTTSVPADAKALLTSVIDPSFTTEKSPTRGQEKATLAQLTERSPTIEKPLMDEIAPSTTVPLKKPSTLDKQAHVASTMLSNSTSPVSPIPSVQRFARVTPSPGLTQLPKSVTSEIGDAEPQNPKPIEASTIVDDPRGDRSSKTRSSDSVVAPSLKIKETYSANLFVNELTAPEKKAVVTAPQSPPWVKNRSVVQDGPVQGLSLKANGSTSIFPKTSPSFHAPKLIEEATYNGDDSSSSLPSRESNYRGSSSPFRKTFGEVRSTWAQSSASEVNAVSSSATLTPSASARSWQKRPSDSRPSWSHDSNSSPVEIGISSKPVQDERRPWQTRVSKSSLSQQDRQSGDKFQPPSLSSIHRNSYIDNQSPVQTFKPSLTIKELAAAFESRTPDKSYITYSDASTPSDEEFGEIPMVSPPRVDEVRKSLNSQFGQ